MEWSKKCPMTARREVAKIRLTLLETSDATSVYFFSRLLSGVKTRILIQPLVRRVSICTVNANTCTRTYPRRRMSKVA